MPSKLWLKNVLLSLLFGVGGPFPNWFDMADAVTNGLSIEGANPWELGDCGPLLALEPAGCVSGLVILNSEGNFPELLCLRRLLVGPWKLFGDPCRDRFRGVGELDVLFAEF